MNANKHGTEPHECKTCAEMARIMDTPHLAFIEKMEMNEIEEYQRLLCDSWEIERILNLIRELYDSRYLSEKEKVMLSNRASKLGKINFEICHKLGLLI